jgi:hypothetical protein
MLQHTNASPNSTPNRGCLPGVYRAAGSSTVWFLGQAHAAMHLKSPTYPHALHNLLTSKQCTAGCRCVQQPCVAPCCVNPFQGQAHAAMQPTPLTFLHAVEAAPHCKHLCPCFSSSYASRPPPPHPPTHTPTAVLSKELCNPPHPPTPMRNAAYFKALHSSLFARCVQEHCVSPHCLVVGLEQVEVQVGGNGPLSTERTLQASGATATYKTIITVTVSGSALPCNPHDSQRLMR